MFTRHAPRLAAPLAVLAVAVFLSPHVARAQPLADRIPADSVVYVGWQGSEGLSAAYKESRLKAVLDASDANQLMEFFPKLVAIAEKEDKQAGEAVRLFTSLAKPMWRHPTAFVFGGVDFDAKPEPMPKVMLLCKAGEDARALSAQLRDLLKQGPPDMQQHVKLFSDADLIGVSVGYPDLKGVLAGGGGEGRRGTLSGDADFKAALSKAGGKNPACVAYANVEKVWALMDQGIAREGSPRDKEQWPKAKRALGLEGIKRFVWTSGFDGKDWSDQVFVAAPEPRKGLLKLGEATPVSEGALASIPKTATMAGVAKLDPHKLFTVVREIAAELEPQSKEQVDGGLAQVKEMLKLNVEKDLLQALGDEWVYYTDPNVGGRGLLGIVLVNRLRDEKKATTSLAIIETFANAQLAEQMKNEQMKVAIYQTKHGDMTIHYLGTPLVTPSWAIKDGNLYVALFPQIVSSAARHVSGKGESITANKDFAALRQRLGGQNAIGFSFMDLPRTAPDAYAQWLMVSRLSGFADLFGVQSPAMLLPPIDRLMPHLTPAGSVVTVDKEGWHARAVGPFPGATALASDPFASMMTMQPLMMLGAMSSMAPRHDAGAAEAPDAIRVVPEPAVPPAVPPDPGAAPPVAPPPPPPPGIGPGNGGSGRQPERNAPPQPRVQERTVRERDVPEEKL